MNFPVQARLVEIIRQQMPENHSLAQELGQILGLSADSVYRRIRCQTAFSLDEATLVCKHFDVPLEGLNNLISNVVSFKYQPSGHTRESFREYLEHFLRQMKGIAAFPNRHIYYAAEDIPVFHHFSFPCLSDFKFYYWRKTILNHADLQNQKFVLRHENEGFLEIAQKVGLAYSELETTEIWTEETIGSTMKQIKFYHDAGLFEKKEDAVEVVEDLYQLILSLQKQCDLGLKVRPGGSFSNTPFTCYLSDLMIGSNCVLVQTDDRKTSFLGYNTFNFMSTGNPGFNTQNELWMNNLISKSTQISKTAEKLRNQFFKGMFSRLEALKREVAE